MTNRVQASTTDMRLCARVWIGLTAGVAMLLAQTPSTPTLGKEVFEKRCTGCHALDNQRAGPKLRGVYGRKAGVIGGFPYSDELKASGIVWDAVTLDKWLTDPEALVPGNDMAFRVSKAEERVAIIEFLRTQHSSASINEQR
jgi:cytochrome c